VLPVLILASIAILLDSPGRVLYRRGVVGKGGRPFAAWKLRTMIENGDAHVTENSRLAEEYNNNHKLREDPRVTGVGKLLRKSSIDELPQLFNVLRGEMSLVGPRMISFPELEKFGEWQEKILEVKPGITGLWQVRGRGDLDYDERVRLNVYYVDNRSVLLDLRILAKTIPAVLTGKGAF
jgi:lipopolysaccharide/colanic/teichoic acid biosynthesis glycosyltransferase